MDDAAVADGMLRKAQENEMRAIVVNTKPTPFLQWPGLTPFLRLAGKWVALGAMGVSLAGSAIAPWLSARLLISVKTELSWHNANILLGIAGAVSFWLLRDRNEGDENRIWKSVGIRGVLFASVLILFILWRSSSGLYFHWVMQRVPKNVWIQIAKETESLQGMAVPPDNSASIKRGDLPQAFDWIGRRTEYLGGLTQRFEDRYIVFIKYGYQARRWGIWRGNEQDVKRLWPRAKIAQVGENLFYFVTPD